LITLMCGIGLSDTITLNFPSDTRQTSITCSHPDVPEDATNLAMQAANLFFESASLPHSVQIHIEKRIPVGAGLGGGSSNAATVLTALNRRFGSPIKREDLMRLGLSIGADVPFFIFGKPALASGIGERLRTFEGLEPYPIVVIFPRIGISTATVYKNLNLTLTKYKNKHSGSFLDNRKLSIEHDLSNDLEAAATALYPNILSIKNKLLRIGAAASVMSGSGSSVFGIFRDKTAAHRAWTELSRNESWEVFLTELTV